MGRRCGDVEQRTTDDRRPATGDRRPATGDRPEDCHVLCVIRRFWHKPRCQTRCPVASRAVRARLVPLVFAAAVLVTTASACSTLSPDAAKVGSTHISQHDFERDLRTLITNEGFKKQATSIANAAKAGAVDADLSRSLLNLEIRQELVHQIALSQAITGSQPATADEASSAYGFSPETWAALPPTFQNHWANALAEQQLVQSKLNGPTPDEAAISAFYEQVKDQIPGQTLEQVRPQIVQQLQSQWNQPFLQAVTDATSTIRVSVDPRYGVWDPTTTPLPTVVKLTPPAAGADRPVPGTSADAAPATTQP